MGNNNWWKKKLMEKWLTLTAEQPVLVEQWQTITAQQLLLLK